jgi:hypothetical protein
MRRLAPSAYQSAGNEWQVQSKRPDQPRFVPWTRIISSDLEQVCSRMRSPPLGSGAVRRALDAFHSEENMFLSKKYWTSWVRSSGDASVVEHHH